MSWRRAECEYGKSSSTNPLGNTNNLIIVTFSYPGLQVLFLSSLRHKSKDRSPTAGRASYKWQAAYAPVDMSGRGAANVVSEVGRAARAVRSAEIYSHANDTKFVVSCWIFDDAKRYRRRRYRCWLSINKALVSCARMNNS